MSSTIESIVSETVANESPGSRPVGRHTVPPGKLLKGRISKPALVLPAPNRRDPWTTPPAISRDDAQRVRQCDCCQSML